ncbi:ribosome maturation factor [candidate division KSB3 bacterium]|uniref:Ribosome maturation factor RimP n=1 Tax=candidate division KSB3 bacterium TaxID=2044937 RepID=A0A2G6E2I0_9BACT|nr:MAG: ribosome maturation factor [candidate division KSB3 bacterium]PIE28572.1 MAG: ribosome maturation factor [candidate division KSB3 bacterium]
MAGNSSILESVKTLVEPIIRSRQLELVDVEFKHEGPANYLRIFIDKSEGVTLDDCQDVSRECELVLDVENIIQTQYILEISSPGLDRPLKKLEDYLRFQGHLVKIKTYRPIDGQKTFLGYLRGVSEEGRETPLMVILATQDGQEYHIPYDMIGSARLEVEF